MSYTKITEISLRKDTKDNWLLNDPILINGELGIITDPISNKLSIKIGDGTTKFSSLNKYQTFLNQKELEDEIINSISINDKNQDYIIHPYNSGTSDTTANYTCLNATDNTSELDSYIATLPSNATIKFGRGIYKLSGTLNIGGRKLIGTYGSSFTCTSSATVETPFISISAGFIDGCSFVFSGTSTLYTPCIVSTNNTTIKNCSFTNFLINIKGSFFLDTNTFIGLNSNVYKIIPTGDCVVKNNFFNGINSLIDSTGKNYIINNFVQQIKLVANTGSFSAFNTVTVQTNDTTGNKTSDFFVV